MLGIHTCLKEGLDAPHMRAGGRVEDRRNAGYFAKKFECSAKTIVRDIDCMKTEMNLPIAYDHSHYTYYYTKAVGEFPLVMMSEGELVALMVARASLHQYKGAPYEKELMSALGKLEAGLSSAMDVDLDAMARAVSFRHAGSPVKDTALFELLAEAVMHRRVVAFDYRKPGLGRAERRAVHPLHLTHLGTRWYLVAHDEERNGIRQFILGRIAGAAVVPGRIFPATPFSSDDYYRNSFGIFVTGGEHAVRIRFSDDAAEVVREGDWHPTQKIETGREGTAELTMSVSSLDEVAKWVLSFGAEAEAVEPAALREKVRVLAEGLVKRHLA